jgi:hypothetical protein
MWARRLVTPLLLCVAACSSRTASAPEGVAPVARTSSDAGSIGLSLTLQPGLTISTIQYTISNSALLSAPLVNSVDVSNSPAIAFVVGGLPVGAGYNIALTATDSAGDVCAGSASFSVAAATTSTASVNFVCTQLVDGGTIQPEAGTGGALINADASVIVIGTGPSCGIVTALSASPSEVNVGGTILLDGAVSAGATISWSTTGGTLSSTTSSTPTLTSSVPGTFVVTATANVAGNPDCTNNTLSATMIFDAIDAGGADAGSDGGSSGPTFAVVRVGDGTVALTTNSAPVFIETHDLTGALIGTPIALPVAAAGNDQPFTLSGQGTTEGDLATSADGHTLSIAGYGAVPATASVTSALSTPRVVARIGASGDVDTSTQLPTAFATGTVRSAVSNDGSEFWVAGISSSTATTGNTGGIWYVPFGTNGCTQLVSLPSATLSAKMRWIRIFSGQLYGGSDQAPPYLFTVGTGLPISGSPALTELPGFPTTNTSSPYGFVMFPALGTLYVADQRTSTGGDLQKWSLAGGTWSEVWSISSGTTDAGLAVGYRGLAGYASGSAVTLMATTGTSLGSQDQLAVIVDTGVGTPVASVVAMSAPNTAYRGVAISPM